MRLGEQIGQERGQITGMRVLPGEAGRGQGRGVVPGSGTLLGVPVNDMGTYVSVSRSDGTLFGDGQGVVMSSDGEMVAWRGQDAGHFTGKGTAVSRRNLLPDQAERFAQLNGIAAVFEYDTDEDGKSEDKTFERK